MSDERFRAVWLALQQSQGMDLAAAQELVYLLQRARGADPLGGVTVYVLTYSHRHGNDITVYQTEDDAWSGAYNIVQEWWCAEELEFSIPEHPVDAIQMYLDAVPDESFNIEPKVITPTPLGRVEPTP